MEWKRISEEIESRGKIKTRGFALRFVKPVCSCVQVPWLVRPAHLKLSEAGSEKTGSMILSLLESCIFLSQNFYFSPCLKFCWYLQFEVKRVTLGLSPKKETMKATVHNLCKMCLPSAMVFASSWGCPDANAPAVSSILVQHAPDNGLRSGVLGGNGKSFLKTWLSGQTKEIPFALPILTSISLFNPG